jgi:hypothetical protein
MFRLNIHNDFNNVKQNILNENKKNGDFRKLEYFLAFIVL